MTDYTVLMQAGGRAPGSDPVGLDMAFISVTFQFLHWRHAHDVPERKGCLRCLCSAQWLRVCGRLCIRLTRSNDGCEHPNAPRGGRCAYSAAGTVFAAL